jgi:hypothetical protein
VAFYSLALTEWREERLLKGINQGDHMNTTRRSLLSKAIGFGVATSVAGMMAFPAIASADDHREKEEFKHHPQIGEALTALRHAREEIATAKEDFRGHKDDALRAVDNAIHELEFLADTQGTR